MSTEVNVALTALIVSLVALFIASGQLLQQIFGTADGYRRCQETVIGPWSKKTRLVWRWKEFRFETKFTTPEIILYENFMRGNDEKSDPLIGIQRRSTAKNIVDLGLKDLPIELKETVQSADQNNQDNYEVVTWTSFLRQLYILEHERHDLSKNHAHDSDSRVGVVYRERT